MARRQGARVGCAEGASYSGTECLAPQGQNSLGRGSSVCLAGTLCLGLVGCTDDTGNETEQTTCTFEETTHYANGDTEVNEYVARYVGARLTIEKEYEEGTYYTYRYDIDSSTDDIVGASSGSLGSCEPEPGTYYMEAPVNDTGSFRFTLQIIINEPVDPRVTPQVAFDPNGAVNYEDGIRYVYEYDGNVHYPMIYGIYEGEKYCQTMKICMSKE